MFEPVTLAVHLEDMDVMGQTIQQFACEPFGSKPKKKEILNSNSMSLFLQEEV
jgi:hypothetical protein